MLIYLAQPIDQADATINNGQWLAQCANDALGLVNRPLAVYRPNQAWSVLGDLPPNEHLQNANLEVLNRVDLLLAVIPAGVPTLGVPVEIEHALRIGTPVLILTDLESSWTVAWWAARLGVEAVVVYNHAHRNVSAGTLAELIDEARTLDEIKELEGTNP